MSALARLVEEWHGAVPVARVHGEVDSSNAGDIGLRIRSLVTNQLKAMVVDLEGTTYLDSAGINLLFALGEELRARQQRLLLVVAPSSPIARMIVVTGLDQSVPVRPSLHEALAVLDGD